MRVAALSLAGVKAGSLDRYRESLAALMDKLETDLVVLPAHTALWLHCAAGGVNGAADFRGALLRLRRECTGWNERYLKVHGELARRCRIYLVAGTTLEKEGDRFYHTSYYFDPRGEICAMQRQTHLSLEERSLGLHRGTDLSPVDMGGMKVGIVAGTDARHPEVGRILALQGADILAHPGALEAGPGAMPRQLAGLWAQVQQNECFAVEAQLHGRLCGRDFGGRCAVLGPCVAAEDLSGFLDLASPGAEAAFARLDPAGRQKARESFPVFAQINPPAYRPLWKFEEHHT